MISKELSSRFTYSGDVAEDLVVAIAAGEERMFTVGSLEIPVASLVSAHTYQRFNDPSGNPWSYTRVELHNGTVIVFAGSWTNIPKWFDDRRKFPNAALSWRSEVPARIWKRDLIKLVNSATEQTYLLD